jgi:hypothetical protein
MKYLREINYLGEVRNSLSAYFVGGRDLIALNSVKCSTQELGTNPF